MIMFSYIIIIEVNPFCDASLGVREYITMIISVSMHMHLETSTSKGNYNNNNVHKCTIFFRIKRDFLINCISLTNN